MLIRPEQPTDQQRISELLVFSFPTPAEARLVELLRQAGHLSHAWVAEVQNSIAGFVGFSPLTLAGEPSNGLGLAPLAVSPRMQHQGIGSQLTRHGLKEINAAGFDFVVVLGEPEFYGRFGFEPAGKWNLSDEYGGGIAFQAIVWRPERLPTAGGLVQYAPEFASLGA